MLTVRGKHERRCRPPGKIAAEARLKKGIWHLGEKFGKFCLGEKLPLLFTQNTLWCQKKKGLKHYKLWAGILVRL